MKFVYSWIYTLHLMTPACTGQFFIKNACILHLWLLYPAQNRCIMLLKSYLVTVMLVHAMQYAINAPRAF
jgi:hypothetical protein